MKPLDIFFIGSDYYRAKKTNQDLFYRSDGEDGFGLDRTCQKPEEPKPL